MERLQRAGRRHRLDGVMVNAAACKIPPAVWNPPHLPIADKSTLNSTWLAAFRPSGIDRRDMMGVLSRDDCCSFLDRMSAPRSPGKGAEVGG